MGDKTSNVLPRIDSIHAFLSVDPEDGCEGVIAITDPFLGSMPLIAADDTRLKALWPIAERTARKAGITVRLVKFSTREVIAEITPEVVAKGGGNA